MKDALQLCSLALNPAAPSPTAQMVRIDSGFMTAFGGTFAINVPMKIEVGCCFNPAVVSIFFRKERKAVAYTLNKGKLTLQEGKEKLTVKCLPPEEMVTLDVLGTPTQGSLDMHLLKHCVDVIDPAHSKMCCQGVTFRNGFMEASNGAMVVSAVTELDEDLEFNLPHASAKALMRFRRQVVATAFDQHAVKFYLDGGSSLVSLLICDSLPETRQLYSGEWTPLKLKPETAKDLLSIECESVRFERGNAHYLQQQNMGVIEGVVPKEISVSLDKRRLDSLLRISADIRHSDEGNRVMAVSENCRAVSTTLAS